MKQKFWKRIGAGMLALCLLTAMPGKALAATLAEMEARQQELEEEETELEKKAESLKNDEAQKLEYQQTLQQQIDVMQERIDSARKDINELNLHITELSLKLEKSQEEVQSTIDQFRERLKTLYKAGDIGTVEILLNSGSFSEFTLRNEMIKAMTLHDQQLMDKIEAYMESTQAEREECETSKQAVAKLKKQLESTQEELNGLYKENEAALAELADAQNAVEQQLEKNKEEREKNDQDMQALIEKQKQLEEERRQQAAQGGGEYMGGEVVYPVGGGGVEGFNPIWPLPGVSYVSCYYGGYAGHRGMDIAGDYGTPVVAAESGTVIAANDYDSWGDSWGYYVLIYHNGTFTTRYAHLSGLAVSLGQYVEQGTVVGYEGATGNVTGPHLHFEVYENGSRVDPMLYL